MMESPDQPATLRIRFAGLCLFVPDRTNKVVHVLMPRTGGHAAHHGGHAHHVVKHQFRIHWVSGGRGRSAPLDEKRLILQAPGWREPDLEIRDVFDVQNIDAPGDCPQASHGKANLAANVQGRIELHAGVSKVVNHGARWRISGGATKHSMPTALDWRVTNVDERDLRAMLQGWGVFDTPPDVGRGNTINLWIIHAPANEQFPGLITSQPKPTDGPSHFGAYFTLLKCPGYQAELTDAELNSDNGDPDPPEWPAQQNAAEGMLVTCMVAKAELE